MKAPELDRRVRFDPVVRVAMLPSEQRIDARKARKGAWKPGPVHDELWDGDILDFREPELSPEEFKQLMRRSGTSKRTSLPRSLQRFQKLVAAATEKLNLSGGSRYAGVDMVGARARLSVDLDEDERDDIIPERDEEEIIGKKERDESTSSSTRPSSTSGVRVSYFDFETSTPPVSSPGSSPINQKTSPGAKVTRFEPSPPSEPSPSERYAMQLAAESSATKSISSSTLGSEIPKESSEDKSASSSVSGSTATISTISDNGSRRSSIESAKSLRPAEPSKQMAPIPESKAVEPKSSVESAKSLRPAEPSKQMSPIPESKAVGPSKAVQSTTNVSSSSSSELQPWQIKTGVGLGCLLFIHIFVFRITLFRIFAIVLLTSCGALGLFAYASTLETNKAKS